MSSYSLGGELGAQVFLVAFWLSMALALGLWVARDASARGSDQPVVWAFASVITPVGLPYYLYRRYRRAGIGDRGSSTERSDRVAVTLPCAYVLVYRRGFRTVAGALRP